MNNEIKQKKKLYFCAPKKEEKWMVSIRFPLDIRERLKEQAERDYKGRGKQSQLIEDAVKYYLFSFSKIKWGEYEKDLDYAELIDDIREGLNQKPLGGASQVFFSELIKQQIIELEKKVKLTTPLLRDVRTGIIRKAVSIRLSLGGKTFFDSLMAMEPAF